LAEYKWKRQYHEQKLEAPERPDGDGVTLKELSNQFMEDKEGQRDNGEITARHWQELHNSCELMLKYLGKERSVNSLKAADFTQLHAKLRDGRNARTAGTDAARIRSVFRWAADDDVQLIESVPPMGKTFRPATKQAIRKIEKKREADLGKLMFARDELKLVIDAAGHNLSAMIHLGINCAFGNSDCANLPFSALDLDSGWLEFPREKTGIDRRGIPLR
jgi:hypothetical protein